MTYPVVLYIYDLSQGMARSLGPALGLHDLEGVWHTATVVHGMEIFFGGSGIEHCNPGQTMLGQPLQQKQLGNTSIDLATLTDYLRNVGQTEWHGSRYDLFLHNCNNFSSALSKFLGVEDVPRHILDLPQKVMSSPIAGMLRPIIEGAVPDGQGTAFNDQSGMMATNNSNGTNASSQTFAHFPPKEYIRIAKAGMDLEKVMTKIIEYNVKHEDKYKLSDDQLTSLRLLDESGVKINEEVLEKAILPVMINWKLDAFPLLHLISSNLMREGTTKEIISKLYPAMKKSGHLTTDSPAARMCYRILVNAFSNTDSRSVLMTHREEMIGDLNSFLEEIEGDISPQVEDAVTSLVSNFSKAIYEMDSDEAKNEAAFQIISGLSTIFVDRIKGPDSLYNVVVSIASLVKMSSEVKDLALALDVCTALKRIPKGRMARLDQSVEDCLKLLQ